MIRAAETAVATLAALALLAGRAHAQSCEPEDVHEKHALEGAIAQADQVASIATSAGVRYAAWCRSAAYSFRLAQQLKGDAASDWAEHGMRAADHARKQEPNRVEAHYRYTLCLSVYLREHTLEALTRVDELVDSAKRAVALDETYDGAGPHVVLALIYSQAPRLIGPGDHDLAREHMKRFLALAGDDEGNKVAAAKVHHELGEDDQARAVLRKVDLKRVNDQGRQQEIRIELEQLKKTLDD
jgi:hypothetical protein